MTQEENTTRPLKPFNNTPSDSVQEGQTTQPEVKKDPQPSEKATDVQTSSSEALKNLSPTNQQIVQKEKLKEIEAKRRQELQQQKEVQKINRLNQIDPKYHKTLALFAWLIIPLAYFYVTTINQYHESTTMALTIAAILFTESLSYCLQKERYLSYISSKVETGIFVGALLIQSAAITFFPFPPDSQMKLFQIIALHVCFIFYVMARNGALIEGQLGILVFEDTFNGFIRFPFEYLPFGPRLMKRIDYRELTKKGKESSQKHSLFYILISIIVALILVTLAGSQLVQLSNNFARMMDQAQSVLNHVFQSLNLSALFPNIGYLILAIPCALYVFGLFIGSLMKTKGKELESFYQRIKPFQRFPQSTVYIVIGALCLFYALFFTVALSDMMTTLNPETSHMITAPEASTMAVKGFLQSVSVALLNFSVFVLFYFIAREPLWVNKGTRLATTCLIVFTTLFAGLATWQLFGVYMLQHGPTEHRLLSGWFVIVLIVWCILSLIRLYKPIQSIRYGLLFAVASFSALCITYQPIIQHLGKK